MRERCKITRATEGAKFADHGGDASVEQFGVGPGRVATNSRDARDQGGEAAQHHGAHYFTLDRVTHTGGM